MACDFFETLTLTGQRLRSAEVRYLFRDRGEEFPTLFDDILIQTRVDIVVTGVRIPHMNAIMEQWVGTCRWELADRTHRRLDTGILCQWSKRQWIPIG